MHYQFYIDKKKGIFNIFVNGKQISTFQDPAPNSDELGTSVHLISGNNAPIKLKNIKMSRWNGITPNSLDKKIFEKLNGTGQKILLQNGDAVIGKTGVIDDGFMGIETEFGPMKLLLNSIHSIDLSDTAEDPPLMSKGDIKIYYNTGGSIIVKPISIIGSKLKAFHQAFGEKEFDMSAFNRIELHVYSKEHNRSRKTDSW